MGRMGAWLLAGACLMMSSLAAWECDFEDGLGAGAWGDKRYAKIETASPLNGKQSLLIDTMTNSGEWNPAWHTPAGTLKNGKSYHVSLTVKVLETRPGFPAYLLLLFRPIGVNNGHSDAGMLIVKEVGLERKLAFRVNVPEKPDNYALQLHTHFGVRALVDDVRVEEAEDKFVPADGGAKAALPEKLPTGATEFTVKLPSADKAKVFNARDFGVTPDAENVGPALQEAIAKVRKQCPARLVLEPGVYRLSGKGLLFDSVHDFTFDGQGAKLVFSAMRDRQLIAINHCDQVAFRNFTVDWDWDADPIASLVKAEQVSADGKTCVFRFTGYQKFPVKDVRVASVGRLVPGTLDDDPHPFGLSLEFFKGQKKHATRWLEDNLLEVSTPGPEFAQVAPGQEFRMRHYVYDHNAFSMLLNHDLTLENVTIASAPGMGLLVNGAQQNWQFLGVKIVPAPGRCMSTAADAVHVGSSRGNFRMENCEIAHSSDDAINIHDLGGYGVKLDDHRVLANNLNFHPGNYFQPGHLIELRHADFSPTGFTAKLKEVKNARRPNLEMVFEEKLPEPIGGGFVIFNRNLGTRNVIIRNNRIHNFPRGLLLMADDVTVENNEFVVGAAAGIKLETGYTASVWSEGFGVNNVVIRNNLFERVNRRGRYANENRPDIYINSYMQTDPSLVKTSFPVIKDVLIANNRFVNSTGSPVYVCTAGNVTIAGNVFSNPAPCPVAEDKRGVIGASYAQNLQVLNNRWEGKFGRAGVLYDPETTKGVKCAGNLAK